MNRRVEFTLLVFVLHAITTATNSLPAAQIEWTRQLGKQFDDTSFAISADAGAVYITGTTGNSWTGPVGGLFDVLVAKYDLSGNQLWTRQFGSNRDEFGTAVSADQLGGVYVGGWTDGILAGSTPGTDAFLTKLDPAGTRLWTRQFGTVNGFEQCFGVAANSFGYVFAAGVTSGNFAATNAGPGYLDAFVSKYDAAGNVIWNRQFGGAYEDEGKGVATDSFGNVYLAGSTDVFVSASVGLSEDAFVTKYDADGNLLWTRQLAGANTDRNNATATDGTGNVYVAGETASDLIGTSAGGWDAFLAKYDSAGNLLWARQFGTEKTEGASGVAVDSSGFVYVTGTMSGALTGSTSEMEDGFVRKYDSAGNLLWTKQLRTADEDYSWGIAAGELNTVYFSGWTFGAFVGQNAGERDAFVAKISDTPEPATLGLLIAVTVALLARRAPRAFESITQGSLRQA